MEYEFLQDLDTNEFWVYSAGEMIVYGTKSAKAVNYKILQSGIVKNEQLRNELISYLSLRLS